MILVIGGTGHVGRVLVNMLCDAGEQVRVVTRDPRRASQWTSRVEIVHGDVRDKDTLRRAMIGVDRLFSLSFIDSPDDVDRGVTEAAAKAGVRHITKLSSIGAASPIPIGERHRSCEEWLLASGVPWTLLRPGYFMSNTLRWAEEIRSAGQVSVPVPDGSIAPLSEVDLALVAYRSLNEDGHDGQIYELTGDTLITAREQVAALSRVLGRPIACREVDIDAALRPLQSHGVPSWVIASRRLMLTGLRNGHVDRRTTTFQKLVGREPMTYEEWCRLHRADFV